MPKYEAPILLSILFLITACSSGISIVMVNSTVSNTQVPEPTIATQPIEPTTQTKNETVLLDFAISPDGQKMAIYLNTGVYLYDVKTLKRTIFYQFESGEYYSKLNAWATIYPPFGASGALTFSPDGTQIGISGKFQDEYIAIWDLSTHKIVDYIANYPNGNYVRELTYQPNGETVLIRSTYPLSKLHCVEIGGSEDTLTLVSLDNKSNLFEAKVCNRYSRISSHFSKSDTMSLFHYGASPFHLLQVIDIKTGVVINEKEFDSRIDGLAYDLSPKGNVVAVGDIIAGVYKTTLVDLMTGEKLLSFTGMVDFLDDENRSLTFSQGQLQLRESNKTMCIFDGIEYYQTYSKVSVDNSTIASLTFNDRTFQNSIQIWDISSCKLINTIPFE